MYRYIMSKVQETLVVLKPDAVKRGISGKIITRFEEAGMKIMGMRMLRADDSLLEEHYSEHVDKDFYDRLAQYMKNGPVIAFVLEGVNAVENCRKLVGDTNPKEASPSTIRGKYAHMSFEHADGSDSLHKNLVHASATSEEAEKEIELWFDEEDLHDFRITDESQVR